MHKLPLGTLVLCDNFLTGLIDGETRDGKAVVVLDMPLSFPGSFSQMERVSFRWDVVKELK
jgi:hypothetical protein